MTAISPPIKYHGGKHYLAPHIHALARQVPYTHRSITHAGGLGELWGWEHEGISEAVNDIDEWLMNFWLVLRHPDQFERFRRIIEATPFAEPYWDLASDIIEGKAPAPIFPADRAAWFFVYCRQSMAGRMDCFAPLSRNRTRRGMNEQVSAWLTAIEGLPAVHARLMRVAMFSKDAVEVIRQQDGENTLFYCDPPYLDETRTSPKVYRHEMNRGQHAELLETLGGIVGKFILSGYYSPLGDFFATKYGWRHFEVELPNNAGGGKEKRRMTEVLWTNFDASLPHITGAAAGTRLDPAA
jgi:DNA adenine methylase